MTVIKHNLTPPPPPPHLRGLRGPRLVGRLLPVVKLPTPDTHGGHLQVAVGESHVLHGCWGLDQWDLGGRGLCLYLSVYLGLYLVLLLSLSDDNGRARGATWGVTLKLQFPATAEEALNPLNCLILLTGLKALKVRVPCYNKRGIRA